MNWIHLQSQTELEDIKKRSFSNPQVIFKHSTRCSVSSMALNRFMNKNNPEGMDFYLLDLLAHRQVSNKIAEDFDVYHESPQVLVIKNGACIYDESHNSISFDEIAEHAIL